MRFRPTTLSRTAHSAIAKLLGTASLLTAATLLLASGATADPSLGDKRVQAAAIVDQIEIIGEEVGAAAERYNGANLELRELTAQLADTRSDLADAKELRTISQERIAARVRQLYIQGDPESTLEVILGAKTLDDVLDRVDVVERVARQDTEIATAARVLRDRIARQEMRLENAERRQAAVVRQRAAEQQAIEAKLAERERLLASVKADIAEIEAAERRRQAELRRRAQLELERQRRLADAQAQASAQASGITTLEEGSQPAVEFLEPAFTPPPADASKGAQVVAIALQYLGVPYRWGGASPSGGFDCSGLTMYVYAQLGISLPHHAATQYGYGSPVSRDDLAPGDLVFFSGLGHMGMYIGDRKFIHAPQTGDVVKISSIDEPYRISGWVGARRVL